MKFAEEIINNKKIRLEQKLKEHNALVNEEMLAIEKAINTYEKDDENNKPYIDIEMIIKTEESKECLKEHGFFIDKVSQYIPYGITRVYLSEDSYKEAVGKYDLKKSLKYNDYGRTINPLNNNTSLNDRQRQYLEEQGYYPLRENYFDAIKEITKMLKEKGGC